MPHQHLSSQPGASSSRFKLVLYGFLAIAGFLLYYEHQAHIPGDYLLLGGLLLVCIIMHSFMHGGHGASQDKPEERSIPDKVGDQ